MLRNRPTSWRAAIGYHTGRTQLGSSAELSPITKAILAWMDAHPHPVTPGEVLVGIDGFARWSQTRGDMQRRLTCLARSGRTIAMAGGMFKRGIDPPAKPSLLSSPEPQ